jgi:hypothetical protein
MDAAGLGGKQKLLKSHLRRRGSLRDKSQIEVVDDPVYRLKICDESSNPYLYFSLTISLEPEI